MKSLNYNRLLKKEETCFGYHRITLCKNSKPKHIFVHRLVAEAFISNPDNLPIINHKDETRTNNCVDNLEWCTYKYNRNYGTATERAILKTSTPIKSLDLETNETTYYPSINEAARQLKFNSSHIYKSMYKSKRPYRNRYIFTENC